MGKITHHRNLIQVRDLKTNYGRGNHFYILSSLIILFLLLSAGGQVWACGGGTDPNANFSVDNAKPVVNENVTFTNTTQNNDGNPNSFSWNFGADANPATASTAGPHTVSYTATGQKTVSLTVSWPGNAQIGGGSDTETKNNYINVGAAPTQGAIGSDQTIASGGTPALLTSTTAGGGSSDNPLTYEWQTDAGGSFATIGGATAATYQPPSLTATTQYRRRTVTDWGGVTRYSVYTNPVTITVGSVVTFTTTPVDISCYGGNNGQITIAVTSGQAPYSYRYSADNGATWLGGSLDPNGWIPFTSGSSHVITGLTNGTYLVHIKDNNGTVQTDCN